MNLESIRGKQNGEYDRLEDPLYVHGPIGAYIIAILLERCVTLLFWHLESNPLVNTLGVGRWLLLTFVLLAGALYAWYPAMGVSNDFVRALVYGTAVYHLAAAVTNVAVVIVV